MNDIFEKRVRDGEVDEPHEGEESDGDHDNPPASGVP